MVDDVANTAKTELRAQLLQARRALPAHRHDTEARALCAHLPVFIGPGETVCAYVPVGTEPGSVELIDSLLSRAIRVLLPVARQGGVGPLPLLWGEYRPGGLVSGRFGLQEPVEPWLPAEPHDVLMTHALTPTAGLVTLG